jgi:hypothetical protein
MAGAPCATWSLPAVDHRAIAKSALYDGISGQDLVVKKIDRRVLTKPRARVL